MHQHLLLAPTSRLNERERLESRTLRLRFVSCAWLRERASLDIAILEEPAMRF
jgi:hypothetical protein